MTALALHAVRGALEIAIALIARELSVRTVTVSTGSQHWACGEGHTGSSAIDDEQGLIASIQLTTKDTSDKKVC
jgi:hypothetical protein